MIRWRKIEQAFKHRLLRLVEIKLGRPEVNPGDVDWNRISRILIIRQQDQMGDFLLSTPAIHAVRIRFPDCHIGIVIKDYFADTMRYSPDVDEALIFFRSGKDWTWSRIKSFWKQLRRRWDMAIILSSESHSLTSDVLAWLSGAPWILGSDALPFEGCTRNFLYNLCVPDPPEYWHQARRNLELVRYIGADWDSLSETITVTESERQTVSEAYPTLYQNRKIPAIGFHIGANKSENRWPIPNFVALGQRLRDAGLGEIVILWGPAEGDLAEEFFNGASWHANGIAPSTLRDHIIHFSLCDLVVCNDTGVMHLCAALGTPLVAVFGPTDPNLWKPVGEQFIALRSESHRTVDVGLEEVYQAVVRQISQGSAR